MERKSELDIALMISWRMGQVALSLLGNHKIDYKDGSYADPVTEADKRAQDIAEEVLGENFPDDSLVGEEGLDRKGSSGRSWFIDPIDGTNNFCNNRYGWATALALVEGDKTLVSIIYLPTENQVFFADSTGSWKGSFSELCRPDSIILSSKERLQIVRKKLVEEANVTTWISKRRFQKYENFFRNLLSETSLAYAGVSGAVEMTNISDNCLDGWIQADVKAWDYIPGAHIAEQAGAVLLDIYEYRIVANTTEIAEHLRSIVEKTKAEEAVSEIISGPADTADALVEGLKHVRI